MASADGGTDMSAMTIWQVAATSEVLILANVAIVKLVGRRPHHLSGPSDGVPARTIQRCRDSLARRRRQRAEQPPAEFTVQCANTLAPFVNDPYSLKAMFWQVLPSDEVLPFAAEVGAAMVSPFDATDFVVFAGEPSERMGWYPNAWKQGHQRRRCNSLSINRRGDRIGAHRVEVHGELPDGSPRHEVDVHGDSSLAIPGAV